MATIEQSAEGERPAQRRWQVPQDPQEIMEDPCVREDPLIRTLRQMVNGDEPQRHLLKGKED